MSDFTIESLDAVEDQAPKFGFDALGEARFATGALDAVDTGLAFHRLKPWKRHAFGHRHDEAEEIYVVIAGSGQVRIEDEIKEVRRLDAIRVAPRLVRAFQAGAEGLELLAFGPRHEGDGEIVPDFWTD